MRPERDAESRDPDEIDAMLDPFGDRAGPDPAREPDVEFDTDADEPEAGSPDEPAGGPPPDR
ncbi:MAG: hypothetical protein QOD81_444 [Solirubrobacteraceae bacterium]|jgi:hypothetical protein|nr:hypothetical protein [Solirubrobacteraceae bacterium]